MSYCTFAQTDPLHRSYHDTEYGFPVHDDNVLFERLVLEINQAGLSWDVMLKKREGSNAAFDTFDVAKVARYTEKRVERLLKNPDIIRNRLKVRAVIHNAGVILSMQRTHGSFAAWLEEYAHGLEGKEAVTLFRKQGFKFVGGEILKEFLQSVGHLPSPHDSECPINDAIQTAKRLQQN